jgi:hypothetical protein
MASDTSISFIIDSKHCTGQNANNLTIILEKEFSDIEGIKLAYMGIPCTFYNITSKIGNRKFGIYDSTVGWVYLLIPDGFYDLKSFNK